MALLLRMGGVPARVATGFTPGTLRHDARRVRRPRPRRALVGRGVLPRDRLDDVRPDAGDRAAARAGRRASTRAAATTRRRRRRPARPRPSAASDPASPDAGAGRHRRRRRHARSCAIVALGAARRWRVLGGRRRLRAHAPPAPADDGRRPRRASSSARCAAAAASSRLGADAVGARAALPARARRGGVRRARCATGATAAARVDAHARPARGAAARARRRARAARAAARAVGAAAVVAPRRCLDWPSDVRGRVRAVHAWDATAGGRRLPRRDRPAGARPRPRARQDLDPRGARPRAVPLAALRGRGRRSSRRSSSARRRTTSRCSASAGRCSSSAATRRRAGRWRWRRTCGPSAATTASTWVRRASAPPDAVSSGTAPHVSATLVQAMVFGCPRDSDLNVTRIAAFLGPCDVEGAIGDANVTAAASRCDDRV